MQYPNSSREFRKVKVHADVHNTKYTTTVLLTTSTPTVPVLMQVSVAAKCKSSVKCKTRNKEQFESIEYAVYF